MAAGKPLIQERFEDQFVEEPDLFVLEECGVEVRTEFHFRGNFTLYSDMSARTHLNVSGGSVSSATGEVLLVERTSTTTFSQPEIQIIDEEAETLTQIFEDTIRGVPFKWRVPGEGVVLLDAGTVTLHVTVVSDLATEELISFDVEITDVHGPHPALTQPESELIEIFCAAMQG